MRHFVRQSIKGGRVCSFNQYFKPKIFDEVLKILSDQLNVKGNVYDSFEAYVKFENQYLKSAKEKYENKFNDYRDIDDEEMNNFINKK